MGWSYTIGEVASKLTQRFIAYSLANFDIEIFDARMTLYGWMFITEHDFIINHQYWVIVTGMPRWCQKLTQSLGYLNALPSRNVESTWHKIRLCINRWLTCLFSWVQFWSHLTDGRLNTPLELVPQTRDDNRQGTDFSPISRQHKVTGPPCKHHNYASRIQQTAHRNTTHQTRHERHNEVYIAGAYRYQH